MSEKNLKILLLIRELLYPGGSETFLYSIAAELHRKEHDVYLYSPKLGPLSKYFDPHVIFLTNSDLIPEHDFDAVICMHRPMIPYALSSKGFKIFISNGIIPIELAQIGFDKYISVSEEVHSANFQLGFNSEVIYNGVDTNRFDIIRPLNKNPQRCLLLSNHVPGVRSTVEEVCSALTIDFMALGGNNWSFNTPDIINDSDIVVTLGRGCYESMACGRNVIIFDYRGGDGFVTPKNFYQFRHNNCSCRFTKKQFNARTLSHEFLKYDSELSHSLRSIILKGHSIDNVCKKILKSLIL